MRRVLLMRDLTFDEYRRLTARQRQPLDQQLRRNEQRIKNLAPLHPPEQRTPRQILEDDLANHARDRRKQTTP